LDRSNITDAVIVQTGGYPESMTALSTNAIAGRDDSGAAKRGAARKRASASWSVLNRFAI